MATRKRLFLIFEIENLLIPSYEKSPNLVAIDPKLKKLSTGKQNLHGKHLPPVLIGLNQGRMSAGVSSTEGRYLEDGLVVPGKHLVSARDKQLITILKNELDKKAERLMHMNLVVTEITIKKKLALLD